VLEAFKDVVAAKQDAERFQNEAMIYKNDILPKARGEAAKMIQEAEAYKQTQVAKAKGDAARFDSVVAAYQLGKDVTKDRIYIETMEGILAGAQKIVVDPGTGGIVPYLPLAQAQKGTQ
jgi:modulator of FtsH protease HflK